MQPVGASSRLRGARKVLSGKTPSTDTRAAVAPGSSTSVAQSAPPESPLRTATSTSLPLGIVASGKASAAARPKAMGSAGQGEAPLAGSGQARKQSWIAGASTTPLTTVRRVGPSGSLITPPELELVVVLAAPPPAPPAPGPSPPPPWPVAGSAQLAAAAPKASAVLSAAASDGAVVGRGCSGSRMAEAEPW